MAGFLCFSCLALGCIIFIFPWLFLCFTTVRYYTKITMYYLVVTIVATISIPVAALRPKRPENILLPAWIMRQVGEFLFGIKWELKNSERLKNSKAYVIVANHQTSLDVLGMLTFWDILNPCVAVLKNELIYAGPFGMVAWLGDCIFVDRINTDKGRKALNSRLEEVKEKKVRLWIFPEGTRNASGQLLEFKKGAFHMAVQAQVPILPIVYSPYREFYSKKKKLFGRGKVTMTILPEVSTEGLTSDDVTMLTLKVRNMIDEFLKSSCPKELNEEKVPLEVKNGAGDETVTNNIEKNKE